MNKLAKSALVGVAASCVVVTTQVIGVLTAPVTYPVGGVVQGVSLAKALGGSPKATVLAGLAGGVVGLASVPLVPLAPIYVPVNSFILGTIAAVVFYKA